MAAIALALVGCKKDHAEPGVSPAPPPRATPADAASPSAATQRWYRAVLRGAGTEFAFLLALPAPGTGGRAVIESGLDRFERDVRWDGHAMRIAFPVYQTSLHAEAGADGVLRGAFTSTSRSWGPAELPLVATPIARPSLGALATVPAGAPLALGAPRTTWKLELVEEGVCRLDLEQTAPGDFRGTLAFASGNLVYLAGNGRGDRLVLSSFDGTAPTQLALALAPDHATATGTWLAGQKLDWRERLTATRTTEVALPSSQPSPKHARVALPQLAALAGKPVVLELAGSWCSSCRHAAPVLRELYAEYAPKGIAIVTLLYEFTDDADANREQAEAFRAAYQIPWRVEAVPGTPDELADRLPPGLDGLAVSGFPVALFLDRDHELIATHFGFPVPGSPEFAAAKAAYRRHLEAILR